MIVKKSFPIVGMHCASCAKLIERKLVGVPGVISCAVNYGSETATIEIDGKVKDSQLLDAVKDIGYKAILKKEGEKTPDEIKEVEKKKEINSLKIKVIVSSIPHTKPVPRITPKRNRLTSSFTCNLLLTERYFNVQTTGKR